MASNNVVFTEGSVMGSSSLCLGSDCYLFGKSGLLILK